jgi:hypothetical protein
MLNVIRRHLLSALPAMLLTLLPWSRLIAFNAKAGIDDGSFQEDDYLHGCIFCKNGKPTFCFVRRKSTTIIDRFLDVPRERNRSEWFLVGGIKEQNSIRVRW